MYCTLKINTIYLYQQKQKDMDKRLLRLLDIISLLSYRASKFMNDPIYNDSLTLNERMTYRETLRIREVKIYNYILKNYGKDEN